MTVHIFLSYSHRSDSAYVERLAEHLNQQGVTAWFDREIVSGDRWTAVIRDQIDSCAAFVVVMSPAAEESIWVNREINRAEQIGKPVYPLLLKGNSFFRLSDVQHEDVTAGQMPPARFTDQLRDHLQGTQATPRESLPDIVMLMSQHEDALAMGERGDYAGAAQLLCDVVEGLTSGLGADHPDALMAWLNLSYYLGESGDQVGAVTLLRGLIPDLTTVLGADHPDTQDAIVLMDLFRRQ